MKLTGVINVTLRQKDLHYFDQAGKAALEENAAALGHVVTIAGVTQDDTARCSCGWEGTPYWDGADLAWSEWQKHFLST